MREKSIFVIAATSAVLGLSGNAFAQAFAGQSFDIVPNAAPIISNTELVGGVLTGGGRNYVGTGAMDIGFTTRWENTRNAFELINGVPVFGPLDRSNPNFGDSNDRIGVTNFTGSSTLPRSYAGGKGYEFDDGDGKIVLEFDPVDTSSQPSRWVNFIVWFNDTGYEDALGNQPQPNVDDLFEVSVSDGTNSAVLRSIIAGAITPLGRGDFNPASYWNVSAWIPGSIGNMVTLSIAADVNSGSEHIVVDSIEFSTMAIPTPGALSLFGVGGLLALRRRRH